MGVILAKTQKYSEALFHYERVLEAHPESSELRFRMGDLFFKLNKPDEAVKHCKAALHLILCPFPRCMSLVSLPSARIGQKKQLGISAKYCEFNLSTLKPKRNLPKLKCHNRVISPRSAFSLT